MWTLYFAVVVWLLSSSFSSFFMAAHSNGQAMAAHSNGQAILYFTPVVSIFFLSSFSSPILSGQRLDVYRTSVHDVALVQI